MKNRYLRLLPLLGLGLLAGACAPTYQLAVQPAASGTLFGSERPQAQALADSVSLRLDFDGFESGWLVFHVDYRNDSRRPVVIEPASFSYAPGREQADLVPVGGKVPRGQLVPAATAAASQHLAWPALPAAPLPALNPEPSIAELQGQAGREAARARRTDWLGVALLVVAVGADVASATHGESGRQFRQRAALHELVWTYQAVSSASKLRHAVMADNLSRQAGQLSDFALRRVTLLPGQQVHGYVYLPRFDTADGLRVYAPVGTARVPLDFTQTHRRR